MNAATSEARKFSPSPRPTTSGELRRAPTTTSGASTWVATRVNAPSSRWQTARIAAGRSIASPSSTRHSSSSRCATASVSVSLVSSWPRSWSSARSWAKFSMMPLWMTATEPVQSTCGWALRSLGAPWVAHRVCPMPVVAGPSGFSASAASRLASLPARFSVTSLPSLISATPAES